MKKAWIMYDREYDSWHFSVTEPEYDLSSWTLIVYFEVPI